MSERVSRDLVGFEKLNFEGTHCITVSPSFEHKTAFSQLEEEIRLFFPGFLFAPYSIGLFSIENTSVFDDSPGPRTQDTTYEGIFGYQAVQNCWTRGNERYSMHDWSRPIKEEEKGLIDLILERSVVNRGHNTIHKVWKLQKSESIILRGGKILT